MPDHSYRVLVCGGRDYRNGIRVGYELDLFNRGARGPITQIIHGGATGADAFGKDWAHQNHVPVRCFRAQWHSYGKAAGVLRNQKMLDEGKPHLVLAFPGRRGTADMVRRAERASIEVFRALWPDAKLWPGSVRASGDNHD